MKARQLLSIADSKAPLNWDADVLSRPIIGRDEIYVLQLVRSVSGDPPRHLDLLKIGLDGQTVQRVSKLELPPPSTDPDRLVAWKTTYGRSGSPLRCPQISDGCLYCSLLPNRGGIAVFPLNGKAPRMIAHGAGEGRPIGHLRRDRGRGQEDLCVDPGDTDVQSNGTTPTMADGRRSPPAAAWRKKTPLDCPIQWAFGSTYDRYHDRILFYVLDGSNLKGDAKAGLFQFTLKDQKISMLKACTGPIVNWVDLVDPDRLWFGSRTTIDQYDMKADRWTEVFQPGGRQVSTVRGYRSPCSAVLGRP